MSENPYKTESADSNQAAQQPESQLSEGKAIYNTVSDTVTGVNFRGSDNKFQAKFIGVSVLVLAGLGALLAGLNQSWDLPWWAGALAGAFLGLIVGVFASGIFLMIYRAVRHSQGKHD